MLLDGIFSSGLLLCRVCILCAATTSVSTSTSDHLHSRVLNKALATLPFLLEPLVIGGSVLAKTTASVLTRHPHDRSKRILVIRRATKGYLARNGFNLNKRMSDTTSGQYPSQISSSPPPSGSSVPTPRHAIIPRPQPEIEFVPQEDYAEDIPDMSMFQKTLSTTEPTVYGRHESLNWGGALDFCTKQGGELAKLKVRDAKKYAQDAKEFIDEKDEIELWNNAPDSSVYVIQGASTSPRGLSRPKTDKETLPFYCQFEGDIPTTSSSPVTTPSSSVTTPSSSVTTPSSSVTTPSSSVTTPSSSVTTPSSSVTTPSSSVTTPSSPVTTPSSPVTTPSSLTTTTSPTTSVPPTTSEPNCCLATVQRGVTWKYTCGDTEVTQNCPPPAQNGTAVWYCNGATGQWYPDTPDLSSCKSSAVNDILKMIDLSNIPATYNYLSQAAAHAYAGGDIIAVADVINNVTSTLDNKQNFTAEEWLNVVENVTDAVVDTINSFLDSTEMWTDIPEQERVEIANRMLADVNKIGFQLAYAMNDSQHTVQKEHVFLQVIKEPKGSFMHRNLTLPLGGSAARDLTMSLNSGFEDDLQITEDDSGYTIALFTSLDNMEEVLLLGDRSLLRNSTNNTEVNSPVVGLSLLENNSISISLSKEMRFVVPRKMGRKADSPVCAFWNVIRKTWSDDGCWMVASNDTHTTCACDHLTNFALLMDIHGVVDDFSVSDLHALTIITYVGCTISIVSLAICVVLTTAIRQLWCIRNTIHRNLALCLLIAEVFLISGLERTEDKTVCSIVAGVLHYFFLAAFCWMLMEAVFIYILLEKVFAQRRSYSERYYLFGYGFPLLIIAISAGANPSGYGTDNYCWLSSEKGMMWSFGAPVLIIVVINFIALVFALRTAIVMSKKKSDDQAAAKQWIFGSMTLVPLLGLTWGVGFLTWNNSGFAVTSAYLFTILNSLQGLTIFLVQVVMNKKVRTLIRRKVTGSFRRVAPLSKSGTASNPRTTSSSENSRCHQPLGSTNSGQSKVSGESVRSRSTFCPDSPVALFNEVLRSGRSYDVSTAQRKHKTRDVVSYGPQGDGESEGSAVVLRMRDANVADDSVI